MSRDWNAVYDILVREAGASEHDRDQFVARFEEQSRPREWRFQGELGFGGKIWDNGYGPLYVNCYREDETPERRQIIERTNAALLKLGGTP